MPLGHWIGKGDIVVPTSMAEDRKINLYCSRDARACSTFVLIQDT